MTWRPAQSIPAIRKELAGALLDCTLYGAMHAAEGHEQEAQTARDGTFVLIQFGVRSGLLSPDEGNECLKAFRGDHPWAQVLLALDKDAEPGAGTRP
jgi:hypothetical protein